MCGGSFSGELFSTQPSRHLLDQVTMRALPDNNADGAEGTTIPYKYLEKRSGGSGVYSFEECIVFVQFWVEE